MDGSQFDDAVRALIASRRALVSGALAIAMARLGVVQTGAKKKRKRKKKAKKPKPNEYGCLEVGAPCKSEADCCSGICEGGKGKKRCQGHGAGTCSQEAPGFCQEGPSAICDNSTTCVCARTTAGSNFCGTLAVPSSGCADCQTDADCEALGFPPGSACVPFSTGICGGNCESGMVCMARCGTPLPEG